MKLWLCASLWLAFPLGCSSTHGPLGSTETGNPPFIDLLRVALKVGAEMLSITGEKGAVTPGSASIEITNLTTGDVTTTKAQADGSFEVAVEGSPHDTFVVRASAGGMSSKAVYVARGGAMVSPGPGDTLSCEQRDQLAGAQLEAVASAADKHCLIDSDCRVVLQAASCHDRCQYALVSYAGQEQIEATAASIDTGLCSSYAQDGCKNVLLPCVPPPETRCSGGQCVPAGAPATLTCSERDQAAGDEIAVAVDNADKSCKAHADCVTASTNNVCHDTCGWMSAVSQAGRATIEAAVASVNSGVCGSFLADGCQLVPQPCPNVMNGPVACMNGQCQFTPANGMHSGCTTCLTETIEWGDVGGFVAYQDRSSLVPCAQYTHRRQASSGEQTIISCSTEMVECNSVANAGAVQSALANADLQQALASSPVVYGVDPRGVDGTVFQIKLGTRVVEVGWDNGQCSGAQPSCTPIPAGVQALVDLLRGLDSSQLATPACDAFRTE